MFRPIYSTLLWCLIGAWPGFGQSPLIQSQELAKNWLKYRGEPPIYSAVGTLAIPEEKQGKDWTWSVSWVKTNQTTKVSWTELRNGAMDPYTMDVVSIFGVTENKLLVWGNKFKWGWIKFDPETMQYYPDKEHDWKVLYSTPSNIYSSLVQAPNDAGPLREFPNDHSRVLFDLKHKPWRRYTDHRTYYEYIPEGSWVLVLEQRNDWVRVRLPKSELKIPGNEEETYTLKIDWDIKREGWIRWCRPGPVKGSKETLLRYVAFGFYD
jgi:hypothetical protein